MKAHLRYIGISVLCIAKLHLYNFHYNEVLPTFNMNKEENKNVRLLMTDTDSLLYHIKKPASTVYSKLKENDWMDFSNYKTGPYSHFYNPDKYLTPGFYKDEAAGLYIFEFCGELLF